MIIDGVTRPSRSSMKFSESLLAFLRERNSTHPFKIGEWLSALDENLLSLLADVADEFALYGAHSEISPDLVCCAKIGLEAETNSKLSELNIEECLNAIVSLCVLISVENIWRKGWIEIYGDLSIAPGGTIEYGLTEEGLRNKGSFPLHLH